MSVVEVTYFSDVLCIWAYASQARIDAVKDKFGGTIQKRAVARLVRQHEQSLGRDEETDFQIEQQN